MSGLLSCRRPWQLKQNRASAVNATMTAEARNALAA
jgi:hypothetical protein